MSVQRIIPVLLHKSGRLVLSRDFNMHHDIGDALHITDRLKNWDVDELVYLDITPHWSSDGNKNALFEQFLETVKRVSANCFVPLSAGGGLTNIEDMQRLIHAGADRLVLNSAAFDNPTLITQAAHTFGTQAIIVCLDIRKTEDGYVCYSHGGSQKGAHTPVEMAKSIEALGAGELIIQAMHCDGQGDGYDLDLLRETIDAVSIPVIALGGAGQYSDFAAPLESGAGACAAANIFTFKELSYRAAKDAVLDQSIPIRPGTLGMDYKAARQSDEQFCVDENTLWMQLGQSGFME